MSGEEAGAIINASAQLSVTAVKGAVTVAAPIAKLTVGALAAVAKAIGALSAKTYDSNLNQGHMSIRRLHKLEGGDLHNVQVSKDDITQLKKSLKQHGVNFNISHDTAGHQFVSFAGKDLNTVELAVRKALGSTLEDLTIRSSLPDSTPTESKQATKNEPTFASYKRADDGTYAPTMITKTQAQKQLAYMQEHVSNPSVSDVTKERWSEMLNDWKGKDATLDKQIEQVAPKLKGQAPSQTTQKSPRQRVTEKLKSRMKQATTRTPSPRPMQTELPKPKGPKL